MTGWQRFCIRLATCWLHGHRWRTTGQIHVYECVLCEKIRVSARRLA